MLRVVVAVILVGLSFSQNHFRPGYEYEYDYTAIVSNVGMGLTESASGYKFTCRLSYSFSRRDEGVLNIQSCRLYERIGGSNTYRETDSQTASSFTNALKKFAMQFKTSNGYVIYNGITTDSREDLEVRNIKRAMVSAVQFNPTYTSGTRKTRDVYGECQTTFSKADGAYKSTRDLAACKQSRITQFQSQFHSNIKQLTENIGETDFLDFRYTFNTEAMCVHKLEGPTLKSVRCVMDHKLIPYAFVGEDKLISIGSEITQKLLYRTRRRTRAAFRSNSPRRIGIMFEFEDKLATPYTTDNIYQSLTAMADAFNTEDTIDAVRKYEKLVEHLRGASESNIAAVSSKILQCRCATKRKDMLNMFFLSALKTCGSEGCIGSIMKIHLDKKSGGKSLRMFFVDTMMNHDPKPGTLSKVMDICKTQRVEECELLLSGMARRYALTVPEIVVQNPANPVYQTVSMLNQHIQSYCNAPDVNIKRPTRLKILTALKSFGNLGHVVQLVDKVSTDRIIENILKCIHAEASADDIKLAAINSFHKMNMEPQIKRVFSHMISTDHKSVVYRTSSFAILMHHEDAATVGELHAQMLKEKSSNMRNFMITYIKSLLQSQQKEYATLQQLWKAQIAKYPGSIPELDELMFHKSRYSEISRQFVLPLSQKNIGIQMSLSVVYEEGNALPRSAAVNITLTWMDKVINLLELGGDFQGMETLLEAIFERNDLFKDKSYGDRIQMLAELVDKTIESLKKEAEEAKEYYIKNEAALKLGLVPDFSKIPDDIARILGPAIASRLPKSDNAVKQIKKVLEMNLLPPSVNKEALRNAVTQTEEERALYGIQEPPGKSAKALADIILFKPMYEFLDAKYRNLHKKMFEGINYPRMNIPQGSFYAKTLGNEIRYVTVSEFLKLAAHFSSMEKIIQYFQLPNLIIELKSGKPIQKHVFFERLHMGIRIPSIIGIPINMTTKLTGLRCLKGTLKVDMNPKVPNNVNIDGDAVHRMGAVMTGQIHVKVPTTDMYTGLEANVTSHTYLNGDASIYYLPVPGKMTKPRQIKLTVKNPLKEREVLGFSGGHVLKHWRDEEFVPGKDSTRITREKCSPESLQTMMGRKACWNVEYQNTSHLGTLPYFPNNGPFSASYKITPFANAPDRYVFTVDLSKVADPQNPQKQLDKLALKYEGLDASNRVGQRKVTADIVCDPSSSNFKIDLKSPINGNTEVYVKWNEVLPKPVPKGYQGFWATTLRKDLIMEVRMNGKKTHGLNYYRIYEKKAKGIYKRGVYTKVPEYHLTLWGNYTMDHMSMDALIKRRKVEGQMDSESSLDAKYFCDQVNSPLYLLHLNTDAAKRNGHLTQFHAEQSMKMSMSALRQLTLKILHSHNYPGQRVDFSETVVMDSKAESMTFVVGFSYIDSKSQKQQYNGNGQMQRATVNGVMDYTGTGKLTHGQAVMDLTFSIKGTYKHLTITETISYKKNGRRKRSLRDALWKLERGLVRGAKYVSSALTHSLDGYMGDTGDRVDWNNWSGKLVLVYKNTMSTGNPSKPGYAEVTLDVNYPRVDTYQELKSNLKMTRQKYSYRPTHGKYLTEFGLTSTHLKKGLDTSIGWDGQFFGKKFDGKIAFDIKYLDTGKTWSLLKTTWVREGRKKLEISHNFQTKRTNFKVTVSRTKDETQKKWTYAIASILKSEIAPVLDHDISMNAEKIGSQMTETVKFKTYYLDYSRSMQATIYSYKDVTATATFTIDFPLYNHKYTGNVQAKFKPGYNSYINWDATSTDDNSKYFVEINMPNSKTITVKTQKQLPGRAKTAGLDWTLNKINANQIEHVMSWSQRFDSAMYPEITKALQKVYKRWMGLAYIYTSNFYKPFWKKVLPYSDGKTVGEAFDKLITPRIDGIVKELETYEVLGRPVGPMIANIMKNIRAVRKHSMKVMSESFLGKLYKQQRPSKILRYIIGVRIANLIKHWKDNPPRMITNYFYRAWYPKIEDIRRKRSYKMVMSHPILWESFDKMPEVRNWARSLLATLKYMKKLNFNPSNRKAIAMTFAPNHVYTFDGQIYSLAGINRQCGHVLMADFKYAGFSVIRNNDRVYFYSKDLSFSIDKQNNVYHKSNSPAKLPIVVGDSYITSSGVLIMAKLKAHGVYIYCDAVHQICRYGLPMRHYNHSMGLLGTNDEEYLTDLNTPHQTRLTNINSFINHYELTGSGACYLNVQSYTEPSRIRRCYPESPTCKAALMNANSNLANCFKIISPKPFLETCQVETSACNPRQVDPCYFVRAYYHICQANRVEIEHHPQCVTCDGKTQDSPPWQVNVQNSADYLIIVEASKNIKDAGNFPNNIKMLLDKLPGYDNKFALITIQGEAITVHGRTGNPFGSLNDIKSNLNAITLPDTVVCPSRHIKAIHKGAHLMYRPTAHHIALLFGSDYDSPYSMMSMHATDEALEHVGENGLVVNFVTSHEDYNHDTILAIDNTGLKKRATQPAPNVQRPYSSTKTKIPNNLPMTEHGELIRMTNGYLIPLKAVASDATSVANLFNSQLRLPSGMCRKCQCTAGKTGAAQTICSNSNC